MYRSLWRALGTPGWTLNIIDNETQTMRYRAPAGAVQPYCNSNWHCRYLSSLFTVITKSEQDIETQKSTPVTRPKISCIFHIRGEEGGDILKNKEYVPWWLQSPR